MSIRSKWVNDTKYNIIINVKNKFFDNNIPINKDFTI